jgi:hypothetical protein
LVSGSAEFFNNPDIRKAMTPFTSRPQTRLWTDDYSSLFGVLK